MRIRNYKKLVGALLVGLVVFSCKKSFLERPPEASFNSTTLANEKGVNAVLIGAYAALDGWADNGWGNAAGNPWPVAGSNWIWGSVTTDDATPGSQFNDQIGIERMNRYQYQTDDPYFRAKFQAIYWGIGRANATLRLLKDAAADMSASAKDQIEAEARFLRAYFHFDGYKMWKNIPFVDENVSEFRLKNDVDILPKIEADLQFAISKLAEKSNNSSGRASKGAARAVLARAYMLVGKYAEAKPILAAIIAGGNYSLENNFHNNFDASKQNNNEMVFSCKTSVNDGAPESANGNWGDRLMGIHNMPGANACCGFHTATQNLLNAFKTDANGLPIANFNAADYNSATDNLDPRTDFTFGRSGIPFFDWGTLQPGWARDVGYTGFYMPKKTSFHKAQYKSFSTASGWSDWPNAIDIVLIRYADVLLMAAECEIETNGSLATANTYINLIRARAGNYTQGAGTNEAAISQALATPVGDIVTDLVNGTKYKIGLYPAFANQAAARDALRFERRLELAMEGYRYFDLIRWGFAYTGPLLNAYVNVEKNKFACYASAEAFTSKHMLFPIPAVEIELSKIDGAPQLKQNPGY